MSQDNTTRSRDCQDLTGQRFGRFTVVGKSPEKVYGKPGWTCHCDCGSIRHLTRTALKGGAIQSCGCYRLEILRENALRTKTHGRTRTYIFGAWRSMIDRCTKESHPAYHKYGGRGIAVCDRWLNSSVAFIEDMGERPTSDYSLDRIDNNGNYEPGNCRWATRTQQARNVRRNRYLEHRGESRCIGEWAEIYGLCRTVIRNRLVCGWSVEEALTTPVRPSKPRSAKPENPDPSVSS